MGENQSLKKADEWRHLLTIAPVLLWFVWRLQDDSIPDLEPQLSPNKKINMTHSRSQKKLYSAVLLLCAGVRLLATWTITLCQAQMGQEFLAQFCHALLTLGVPLVINHHLSLHFFDMICLFRPIYAWWLFAFECFNGMMEKVKHNSHDGGQMEVMLLQNWVQTQFIYELLLSLLLMLTHKSVQCSTTSLSWKEGNEALWWHRLQYSRARLIQVCPSVVSIFKSTFFSFYEDKVKLLKRVGQLPVNLIQHDQTGQTYHLLLEYSKLLWPDLNLVTQFSPIDGLSFIPGNVAHEVPYIRKDGIWYGCTSNKCTQVDSLAVRATESWT